MKQFIRYKQKTREEREKAALADVKFWLSTDTQYQNVLLALRDIWRRSGPRKHRINGMYLALEFAGVHGLPARAMIRQALQRTSLQMTVFTWDDPTTYDTVVNYDSLDFAENLKGATSDANFALRQLNVIRVVLEKP
jgi:hypothetical protein